MRKAGISLLVGLFLLTFALTVLAQDNPIVRKVIEVPKADSGAVIIDGKMDEPAWQNAAHADLMTSETLEIWANNYGRSGLEEPEFDEHYGRMLWTDDTLYVFVHIDEVVNDSTDLFFAGHASPDIADDTHWNGDQLYIGISNNLGIESWSNWEGPAWLAPSGPYFLMVMGDRVTLNDGDTLETPDEFLCDTTLSGVPYEANFVRSAVKVDTSTGVWDVELAIYNPGAAAGGVTGFNIGGSMGSRWFYEWSKVNWGSGDAYGYYVWQPNVPGEPWTAPIPDWVGSYIQQHSKYWALLKFMPGVDDVIVRKIFTVPKVDSGAVVIDGKMDEPVWQDARVGKADLMTSETLEIWANNYGRSGLEEPEFDEHYGRMLWTDDTLYVFVHIDEVVNDSTDLFFAGHASPDIADDTHWNGDQLYIGISNNLGIESWSNWEGPAWLAPSGPYFLMVMGDRVTLNDGDTLETPDEFLCDTTLSGVPYEANFVRSAVKVDTSTGVWDVELAIYNPGAAAGGVTGFNIGGSMGSRWFYEWSKVNWGSGDAYGYYVWQPNVPGEPWTAPIPDWVGSYIQQHSKYWALLEFDPTLITGVADRQPDSGPPVRFVLRQNYPNPFNPSTNIRFEVAKTSPVTLKVYNLLGQPVAILLDNKVFTPGTYEVTWKAGNLPSGAYFYRLEAGNVKETKKMVLMR